jgi:hypothetical protein
MKEIEKMIREGRGICFYNNGDFYEGDWEGDERSRKCILS